MLTMRLVAAVMMAGTLVLPAWDTSTQTMAAWVADAANCDRD
jgi:hypothetical protein